ncbi:hypothetical protein ASPACDRAFT_57235 [Aspergillus aculeatus ATCC 16872]|uniref:Uncharacterized protein n=1 Tax=Aspergillus aculeatus (strain ATCC 16872 / CBS 172.66 / WB 5094) TaxID=690307 RepID=A0A1L9X6C1_ASPA1|nr:uncharacterized protein ASPACDRAFT_57235 [Aspergillus aculeatus ATCC 16872]OJK03869.1 hypothetical protein ASPACDRAFT_57235 [Aspergillus aculeatus ATCC 16872]
MSSSNYYPSSPRFAPPPSAQPQPQAYQSIFGGGDSSQDVGGFSDLEPYPDELEGNLDTIMEEGGSPRDEGLSDDSDSSYLEESEEEGEEVGDVGGRRGRGVGARLDGEKGGKVDVDVVENRRRRRQPSSPSSSSPDADDEDHYRPNRFRGPESTWRNLTAEDRQNAQALVDLRARDLAAHLYNAYALRVRAREIARRMTSGALGGDGRIEGEEEVFAPPKRWTAWPMPAAAVPRPGELVRRAIDDAWTLRRQPDPRPSAELEESLMAVMMKTAKERFNAREWETTRPATGATTPRRGKRKPSMSQTGTQDESAGDWESEEVEEPETVAGMRPVALRPVVQADDERSRVQLRPLTRNILTQFDTLLMGLHRARQGDLARDDDSSASEWQTDTASAISGSSSGQQPKRKGSAAEKERSLSRGRKRTRRSSIRSESSAGPSRSRSTRVSSSRASSERTSSKAPSSQRSLSRGSSRSRGRSRSSDGRRSVSRVRQGLRDWSEVLGIASMTGFPAAAVMRASRRCADLFGEDMAFRTFHEGQVRQDLPEAGGGPGPWQYVESESEPEAELEHEPEPEPQPEAIPVSSRASSRKPRSRATSLKGGSRSRATSASADDTPRPRGKGEHRKSDLVCPIRNCDRHYNGFSRTWNLNQHLKTMHPGYQPPVSARKLAAAKASSRKGNANEG